MNRQVTHGESLLSGACTLIVLSPEPVANHSLLGSTAMHRTHPRCPEITRISFQGGCHFGRRDCSALRGTSCVPLLSTRACRGGDTEKAQTERGDEQRVDVEGERYRGVGGGDRGRTVSVG